MKDKKVVILVMLLVLAVLSLLHGMNASKKEKRLSQPPAAAEELSDQKNILPASKSVEIERRAARTQFTSWKRNPFVPTGIQGGSSVNLELGGIMWSGENPTAIVGDAIVKKGDKLGMYEVIEIKQDRVILSDGTKDVVLRLKEE